MRSLAVFCGSATGSKAEYSEKAAGLGKLLAERGIRIIFGGGKVGLMGILADHALAAGGEVTGVIPDFLVHKEIAHDSVQEMIVTDSMLARKQRIFELSDAFVALPGGFGTIDELFEMLTWLQLGRHRKPIGILNIDGYFDLLIAFLEKMVVEGFLKEQYLSMIVASDDPAELLAKLERFEPPELEKWFR
ncbi:MAG: TIGR00730 family Rossman fold protein [Bacteroidetes bacterium]|nr:TIGR00730 family Rossman fold protein [Bacteroidota bacterium]